MKKIIKRLKSPVVWVSIISQIALIVALFNPDVSDTVKMVGGAVVEILTLFGILNNPENRGEF